MMVRSCSPSAAFDAASAEMVPPFDVAGRDCCRTAGLAFARLWGVNPVAGARYRSHAEARAFVRSFGGAAACHGALAQAAGLIEAPAAPGLIGSIAVDGQPLPWVLGLCVAPDEWAVMGEAGMLVITGDARAWGVPWV